MELLVGIAPAGRSLPRSGDTVSVPDRAQLRGMAGSGNFDLKATAFRLMTTVINYDLSSVGMARRLASSFDPDWHLFLEVAQVNALDFPQTSPSYEGVEACSSHEFQPGSATTDLFKMSDW